MISVVILTYNSEETLEKTLNSCSSFAEIIILDTGSLDSTAKIASKFSNTKFLKTKAKAFGKLRNEAARYAKNRWILALDSDEVLSPQLIEEIHTISLNADTLYSIPFLNYYNGKQIKWCGWYPERHFRLYNKKKTKFDELEIHEVLITKNLKLHSLKEPIYHYSYRSTHDFLRKMQIYSSLFAKQYHNKKKSSLLIAIWHGFFTFFRSYILKWGILGGKEGFIISIYNANTAFYKYLKLAEINSSK